MKKEYLWVGFLVTTSFLIRVFRLDTPPTYYFDEVYHAFTAQAYARNDSRGYEWWHKAPEGYAYEWLHPPLAKLIQAGSIKILGDSAFAWRFPGVIFATATVWILYLFGKSLFKSSFAGLAAAFFYAFDGLSFVQSRITMNDIYLTFFIVLAFYLYQKRMLLGVGIALGLTASTKWTGFYAIPILGGLFLFHCFKTIIQTSTKRVSFIWQTIVRFFIIFLMIPIVIYFLSYSQFWLQGHTWQQFQELHKQIWWYQTNLRATHPYQSAAWTWPFMYRPVWYYVNYGGEMVANIYAMGNPIIWWPGIAAIGWLLADVVKKVVDGVLGSPDGNFFRYKLPSFLKNLSGSPHALVLLGYFAFFLPWAFSPRIMFIYHYLPSIPFMCLALGYGVERIGQISQIGQIGRIRITGKLVSIFYLLSSIFVFFYFYPHLSALPIPKWLSETYFWFPSWR